MISQPTLLLVALGCVLLLVMVALWSERHPGWHNRLHPYIYSLTLAVYCTSWIFFGTVGSAAQNSWSYLPIYLGPMLVFVLGMPILRILVNAGARQKTTSLADFIGARYGKRQLLAALVTLVAQQMLGGTGVSPDTYVLKLAMASQSDLLVILLFAGGFSAATGMVIVASVTLSIMVSNEIILPLLLRWLRQHLRQAEFLGQYLRWIRRSCILAILLASWLMYRLMGADKELASIGLVSFACFAQLAPALLGTIYWRCGHAKGVYAGLAVGFLFWWYCLLLPMILGSHHPVMSAGPWGLSWLRPENLFGTDFLDPLSHGVWWSLCSNLLIYISVSLFVKPAVRDTFQADVFVYVPQPQPYGDDDFELSPVRVVQLRQLPFSLS